MSLPLFLAQAQASSPAPELRDIAPPYYVFPWPMWMVYTAGAALLILGGLIVWLFIRWRNRRPPPPPPTPKQKALRELEGARSHVYDMDSQAFSVLVSDILRRYISEQFGVHATQQTSPEFLAAIANLPVFTLEEKKQLAEFLEKCDLIKFARLAASEKESTALLEQAIRFVNGGAP
jgi:hypothetical protein